MELDALRGLAALVVVLYHYTVRYQDKVGHLSEPSVRVAWGHYGVELFFLLSGFVIFLTLEKTARARDFVVSRASRLYPGYWVGMALTLGAVGLLGQPFEGYGVRGRDVVFNATMLQRYVPGTVHVDGAYWTLSLELTFYGWALLLTVCGGLGRVRLAMGLLVGAALVLHGVTAGGHISSPLPLRAVRQVFLGPYSPYFAAGVLFYRLRQEVRHSDLMGLAFCLGAVAWMRSGEEFLASLVCFGIFGLLVAGRLSFLCSRPLLFLGGISYSLYVVHQNIGYLVIRHLEQRGVNADGAIAAALALSLTLATAVTFGVERPAQRAIRSWARRRASSPSRQTGPATRAVRA